MNLSIAGAMSEFISNNTDMCVFVTAFLREDYEIISSGILSKIIENDKEPLHQLCGNERIHPADSVVVAAMCSDLLDKNSARLPDERFSVDFRADVSENAGEPDYR